MGISPGDEWGRMGTNGTPPGGYPHLLIHGQAHGTPTASPTASRGRRDRVPATTCSRPPLPLNWLASQEKPMLLANTPYLLGFFFFLCSAAFPPRPNRHPPPPPPRSP